MTKKEAKIRALSTLWGWASKHYEGIEDGEFSDELLEDVLDGRYTEVEAKKIQIEFFNEGERLQNRLRKLRGLI